MSCITFSSDIMTKVYADRVIGIQFCNSLGVCCIPTGGGGSPLDPLPPSPPPPPPAQATPCPTPPLLYIPQNGCTEQWALWAPEILF